MIQSITSGLWNPDYNGYLQLVTVIQLKILVGLKQYDRAEELPEMLSVF